MILGLHGILGVAFGTTHGTIHSGITHTVTTQDIIHMRHIDHIHMRLTILIIHLITLIIQHLHIMAQTIITVLVTMVLQMLIAEIIIVMATLEATKLAKVQTQETQTAMQLALHTTKIETETQIAM